MTPPKFLIASTGRSGSGYIAQVLTKAGIPCGHQDWFTRPKRSRRKNGLIGESSCFAVPHLSKFEGVIFHQVRNPLHVLTSFYVNRERIKSVPEIWSFRKSFMPHRTGDDMRDFMAMIVNMNEEIDKYSVTGWRVEDAYGAHAVFIANMADVTVDFDTVNKAFDSVPPNWNKHHNSDYLTWDDIEDSPEKELLMKQAEGYGYSVFA